MCGHALGSVARTQWQQGYFEGAKVRRMAEGLLGQEPEALEAVLRMAADSIRARKEEA